MRPLKVLTFGKKIVSRAIICVAGIAAVLNLGTAALTGLSMVVSLAVYAYAFGLQFAIGFVFLLAVHEFGHILASRVVGLKSSGPMFIPFIGAYVNMQRPHNAKMEANIAIGGPALGTLSVLFFLAMYLWSDSLLMLVLAYTGCLLNLFNLIPCTPLDGEKIAAAISPHMWLVGSVLMGVTYFYTYNVFILIIFLFSLVHLWAEEEEDPKYYLLPIKQKIRVSCWYFGLLAVLGITGVYIVDILG